MSTRSNVGLAFKTGLLDRLNETYFQSRADRISIADWLNTVASESTSNDDGKIWVINDITWNCNQAFYNAVYSFVNNHHPSEFLILEACPDYPEMDSESDFGEWWDNPFNFKKQLTVYLSYE